MGPIVQDVKEVLNDVDVQDKLKLMINLEELSNAPSHTLTPAQQSAVNARDFIIEDTADTIKQKLQDKEFNHPNTEVSDVSVRKCLTDDPMSWAPKNQNIKLGRLVDNSTIETEVSVVYTNKPDRESRLIDIIKEEESYNQLTGLD